MMIEQLYERIPQYLKDQSGAVFNAGRSAFSNPSDLYHLYLLGLNPGGDPAKHHVETVDFHTKKVLSRSNDWSEFRDRRWDNRPAGARGMQPRILHLLKGLGLGARMVPASNVVFKRTRSEVDIAQEFKALAEAYWPFHQQVIKQLNIRVVVCFGKTAANVVRTMIGADKLVDQFAEGNRRGWLCQTYSNRDGLLVIGATHPSRVAWNSRASDPTDLVRRAIEGEL